MESGGDTKKKWRGKLFSSKDKNKPSVDQQLNDFLNRPRDPSGDHYTPLPPPPPPPPPPQPSAPASMLSRSKSTLQQSVHSHILPFSHSRAPPSVDAQVDDFLGVSRSKSQSLPKNPKTHANPTVNLHDTTPSVPLPPDEYQGLHRSKTSAGNPAKRSWPRGILRVTFTPEPPAIIGEGGDEADIPTKDVILSYHGHSNDHTYPRADSPEANPLPAPPLMISPASSELGFDVSSSAPPIQQATDPGLLAVLQNNSGQGHRRLSLRQTDPNSFAWQVRAKMREEEGRALQHGVHDDDGSGPLAGQDYASTDSNPEGPVAQPKVVPFRPHLAINMSESSPNPLSTKPLPMGPTDSQHSDAPISPQDGHSSGPASPLSPTSRRDSPPSSRDQVRTRHNFSPTNRNKPEGPQSTTPASTIPVQFPSDFVAPQNDYISELPSLYGNDTPEPHPQTPVSLDQSSPHHQSVPTTTEPPRQSPPTAKSRLQAATIASTTQESDAHQPKKSWRAITNVVGTSALSEFAQAVGQYTPMFQLAAKSAKPTMETPLSEWIKASVWWILKGRAALEAIIRARHAAAAPSDNISIEKLQQAVINLAKAWWINQQIIPQHYELQKFGNINTEMMLGITRSAGDHRLSSLIAVHQSVISHIRALAMSMKRNNIELGDVSQVALLQGIDTTIWVKYPRFSPDIVAVLSGNASKSMVVGSTKASNTSLADMMPFGDTDRYFNYGRMFVKAYLSSRDDDEDQPMYELQCVLSISRDRTDWNVLAMITSQNDLVNIIIQPDKKLGPTWADVHWNVRECIINIKLTRGFQLEFRFLPQDFKSLWRIVEYTRKTEEQLEPQEGETIAFEDVLSVFQYSGPPNVSTFPSDPSPRCRIRLFEKKVTVTDGIRTRLAHRGFRMIAVTSPKIKTLSSFIHFFECTQPLTFGYLRGDDGSPALLLKFVQHEAPISVMLTFHNVEERTQFHSLLLGIALSDLEIKSPDIAMKSYSMEVPGSHDDPSSQMQFAQSVTASIINLDTSYLDHGQNATILSENLRVFINSQWGSVTDRINLG